MQIDEFNDNRQRLVEKTTRRSTTHRFARIWVLECERCGHRYGSNSCDAHIRLCPDCGPPGVAPGEPI